MFKKILSLSLALLLAVSMISILASCKGSKNDEKTTAAPSGNNDGLNTANLADVKIGLIMVGDESEGYTLAHMDGIKAAAKKVGLADDQLKWEFNIGETSDCTAKANGLVAQGCQLVISNSYGHQEYMAEAAEEHEDVEFVAMTGDFAAISGLDNLHNAFTRVYESRYVSGVVAGLKLQELINNGQIKAENKNGDNIKIGYVGAYPYAEVVSGYTAFYLGLKSIVSNVEMTVVYTDSWFSIEKEKSAAEKLMADGCVIIGQHADSTGAPAAVEAAHKAGTYTNVYSVGYNVSMLEAAPTVALTSASNNWEVYYEYLFKAIINKVSGENVTIAANWAEGYNQNAVNITALGTACAAGTQAKVDETIAAIKAGTLQVFDVSKFTVGGAHITENKFDLSYRDWANGGVVVYQGDTVETLKTANGITYVDESTFRSAPYFELRIDGITEVATHIQ